MKEENTEDFEDMFDGEQFEPDSTTSTTQDLDFFSSIPVEVSLEVGSTEIPLSKLMSADSETIIELDKLNGEALDIRVNGKLFGYGEVVVSNNKYALRVSEIISSPVKK